MNNRSLSFSIDASGALAITITQGELEAAIDRVWDNHFFNAQGTCECGAVVHNKQLIGQHIKEELMRSILYGP